jgi:hypothetical protein
MPTPVVDPDVLSVIINAVALIVGYLARLLHARLGRKKPK